MKAIVRRLYDWMMGKASHRHSISWLAIVSFLESSIFPIPPDVMIIPMVIAKKNKFLKIAAIATIFSVLGALFGYLIGYVFFNEVGIKIFEIYGYENPNFLKEKFSTKGGFISWLGILVTAGFTPLPFKLLTISSGFINFNIIFFIIICILTRGTRFFLVAYLTNKFGDKFGPFLEKQGTKWSIIIALIILIIVGLVYIVIK